MFKTINFILLGLIVLISCQNTNETIFDTPENQNPEFITAVDISRYPEISDYPHTFYDRDGHEKDFIVLLKEHGVNTIRLRLWVNPADGHSGFEEVKAFSQVLKNQGFKIWLTLHYSDTWADPAHQEPPLAWQGLSFESLKDHVYNYTKQIMLEIAPDYIQIGNEINSGILHPYGHIPNNTQNFVDLIQEGCRAVREHSNQCKIILHYAGLSGSDWFFNQVSTLDYDIMGLSYYPIWHGDSLPALKTQLQALSANYDKAVIIAETAYPFTLAWNDWTTNIVGLEEQLILPDFPATPEGQKGFITEIKTLIKTIDKGMGFCYWGAELIAWKGSTSTEASPWENQALFDFHNKALPVLEVFID